MHIHRLWFCTIWIHPSFRLEMFTNLIQSRTSILKILSDDYVMFLSHLETWKHWFRLLPIRQRHRGKLDYFFLVVNLAYNSLEETIREPTSAHNSFSLGPILSRRSIVIILYGLGLPINHWSYSNCSCGKSCIQHVGNIVRTFKGSFDFEHCPSMGHPWLK